MCSVVVICLLASLAEAHAKEHIFIDRLNDKLVNRVLLAGLLRPAALDGKMLGRLAHAAIPNTVRSSMPLQFQSLPVPSRRPQLALHPQEALHLAMKARVTTTSRSSEVDDAHGTKRDSLGQVRRSPLLRLVVPVAMGMAVRQRPAAAEESVESLVKLAQSETNLETASKRWNDVVKSDGGSVVSLGGRGLNNLRLRKWDNAVDDLAEAVRIPPDAPGYSGDSVLRAVLYDSLGLARLAQGEKSFLFKDYLPAVSAFGSAAVELTKDKKVKDVSVPEFVPFSGLPGGALTLKQRFALHRALAKWADTKDPTKVIEPLAKMDKGPSTNGKPQFSEAINAYVAALWAAGAKDEATDVWNSLDKGSRLASDDAEARVWPRVATDALKDLRKTTNT